MKTLFLTFLSCVITLVGFSQSFYLKTFGEPYHKALLFLHGGPGGTSLDFELSTAQRLAEKGFYVVVYDRRGEGRSEDDKAQFTFEETFSDMDSIYEQLGLDKAILLAHSFGGIVGAKYAALYPDKVEALILVGAPISLQESFTSILDKVSEKAQAQKDSMVLNQVKAVRNYDRSGIQFSASCFMLAMQHGLYTVAQPEEHAKELLAQLQQADAFKAYTQFMGATQYKTVMNPTMGFLKNENYTSLELESTLQDLRAKQVPMYGIYGREDGLFDESQLAKIKALLGGDTVFALLDRCSHGVYVDRQEKFLELITEWAQPKP